MNKYAYTIFALFFTILLFSKDTVQDGDKINYQNGIYAGKVVQIGTRYWLDGKTDIKDGITDLSVTKPSGFKLPDKKDLEVLLQYTLNESDPENFLREKLSISQTERYLMSSTKVHETITDGSDINAWKFYGLDLKKMNIVEIPTFAVIHDWSGYKKSEYSARLLVNIAPISIVYNGIGGKEREFECNLPDADSYIWRVEDKEYEGKKIKHKFSSTGKYTVSLAVVSNDYQEDYKKEIVIKNSFGSYENFTSIDVKNIVSKDLNFTCSYPEYNVYGYTKLQTAPLICSDKGKIYILSTDENKVLTLIETDINGELVSKKELCKGYPGNLSVKEDTIAYLAKTGTDKAEFKYLNKIGNDVVIMDNIGKQESNSRGTCNSGKGMIFRNQDGKMVFGTEAMFEPFAFGRVELFSVNDGWISIFPHTNNFNASNMEIGKYVGENNNSHSGEMCLYFNDDASKSNLIYGWGASHSMDLRSVYDDEYIASVTLGDVYPCDFRFFLIDTVKQKFISSDIFAANKFKDGLIGYSKDGKEYYGVAGGPGNMAAVLGEVMVVDDGEYGFTYSIKTGEYENSHISKNGILKSTVNELGLMIIDRSYSVLLRKKIREGNDVQFLHSAKYGKNILLAWKTVDKSEYKMALIDKEGNILQKEFILPENVYFNHSDGFDVLSNGAIAWTAAKNDIKKEGRLKLFILKTPFKSDIENNEEDKETEQVKEEIRQDNKEENNPNDNVRPLRNFFKQQRR